MQGKDLEHSVIYWANRYLSWDDYNTTEELLDGNFFYAILENEIAKDHNQQDEFDCFMSWLDKTCGILKNFYKDYDNIMEHTDYRDLINSEIICTEEHVILITELIIGVLIKKAESDRWVEEISTMPENHRDNLVELIQKMNNMLVDSPSNSFSKRSMTQREVSLKWFESNTEVINLKKHNAELRECVLNLESENQRLEKSLKITETNLDDWK